MQTDKLFHEYFHLAPQAVFELFRITPACSYLFSSPVVKSTERRMDGLLEPLAPGQQRFYLEVQGYDDSTIYWRHLQQIGLHHVHNPDLNGTDWRAFILFLDAAHDPGVDTLGPLAKTSSTWLTTGILSDLLKQVAQPSSVLNVLRPLVAPDGEVEQKAATWVADIRADPALEGNVRIHLVELLTLLVVQRFGELTRQEIEKMLQLVPLEKTRAGQELIEQGIEQGVKQGEASILTRLIARQFRTSQDLVAERLRSFTRADFEALSDQLWQMQSLEEVWTWLEARRN